MPSTDLWAGALSQLLLHDETACPHAAGHAARLLERLSDSPDLDPATRELCERASARLDQRAQAQSAGTSGTLR